MDVEMPEMDGLEATAVIRVQEKKTDKHVPIIAMTAHAMKGDRERCLEAGMDDYVAKPIRAQQLFQTLQSVLGAPADAVPAAAEGGIDWNQVLHALDNDRELVHCVVDTVLEEAPRLLQTVREAIANADAEAIRTAAHALKGAIHNLGLSPAYTCAFQLEQMGESGDVKNAHKALEALEEAFSQFLSVLSKHQTDPGAGKDD
jgi:response regulator RpfG family c-di-GMP phosphodiesterase